MDRVAGPTQPPQRRAPSFRCLDTDARAPAERLDLIEAKGREIAEVLVVL